MKMRTTEINDSAYATVTTRDFDQNQMGIFFTGDEYHKGI